MSECRGVDMADDSFDAWLVEKTDAALDEYGAGAMTDTLVEVRRKYHELATIDTRAGWRNRVERIMDIVLGAAAESCDLMAEVCSEEKVSRVLAPGYQRAATHLRSAKGTGWWYDTRDIVLADITPLDIVEEVK